MPAINDIVTGTEQQESTRSIGALGFALPEALVANECALLIANKATNLNSLEAARCDIPVDL